MAPGVENRIEVPFTINGKTVNDWTMRTEHLLEGKWTYLPWKMV